MKSETRNAIALLSAVLLFTVGCATVPELPPVPQGQQPVPPLPAPKPQVKPSPPTSPPIPELPFRDAVAIQALLDRQNFSCNCADGVIGQKTRQALRAWQASNGLPVTGKPDDATLRLLGRLDLPFTTPTVTAEEIAALTPVPKTWWGKSQASRLGYETVLETVAEEYHASEEAIRKLNPKVPWPDPPAGTSLVVPDPRPFKPRLPRWW